MSNTYVPVEQKRVHVAAELAALTAVAPITVYIAATNPQIPRWQRWFLYAVAVGTIAVDGYLLAQWLDGRDR